MSDDEIKTVPARQSSVGYVAVLPDCILSAAIALGWYVRYRAYEHTSILLVGGAGIALIGEYSGQAAVIQLWLAGSNLLLKYYFNVRFSHALYNLWSGCLLGVLALYDIGGVLDSR